MKPQRDLVLSPSSRPVATDASAPQREAMGILRAVFERKTYNAIRNIMLGFDDPIDTAFRYAFGKGKYPKVLEIRTPLGRRPVTLNSFDDMRSLVVCFAKEDYYIKRDISCAVDFGSNIGLSGLYFLTRNPNVKAYLFEPLIKNVERLNKNLESLENRYDLQVCAIGPKNGTATFHYEASGRYGGLNQIAQNHLINERPFSVEVSVRNANDVLREILEKQDFIDILKLNIEGLERDVIRMLDPEILQRIGVICAETFGYEGELPGFYKEQYGVNITRFSREGTE